mmetsp:Transcript_7238/g.29957  ORF Transcript_7238/g.29957 Transcript_7238/m.29957 type:complete len:293 (+) Transcript_7238:283-1161(+)
MPPHRHRVVLPQRGGGPAGNQHLEERSGCGRGRTRRERSERRRRVHHEQAGSERDGRDARPRRPRRGVRAPGTRESFRRGTTRSPAGPGARSLAGDGEDAAGFPRESDRAGGDVARPGGRPRIPRGPRHRREQLHANAPPRDARLRASLPRGEPGRVSSPVPTALAPADVRGARRRHRGVLPAGMRRAAQRRAGVESRGVTGGGERHSCVAGARAHRVVASAARDRRVDRQILRRKTHSPQRGPRGVRARGGAGGGERRGRRRRVPRVGRHGRRDALLLGPGRRSMRIIFPN